MGKRQLRIFQRQLASQVPALIGIDLNIILKNGITIHGKILSFEDSTLIVADAFEKKHAIKIETIEEVILDYTAVC